MKRLLLIVLTPFFLAAVFEGPLVAAETSGPVIEVENRAFDFKKVKQGTLLEHSFKIFNKGDQELRIINVRPG